MAVLVGHRGISGAGVYWQITQPDDPDVLTMVFPEQVATEPGVAVFLPLSCLGPWPGGCNAYRGGTISTLRHYAGDARVGPAAIQ
jgi:hypothetical protein